MPIAKEVDFVSGVTPVSEAFMDLFQEMLAAYVSPNFVVEEQSATSVRVPAGDDSASVGVSVNGEFRRRDTAASASVSGAAGTHSVYVTADSADNLFGLEVTDGVTAATNVRKVAEVEWSGTAITKIRQWTPASTRLLAALVDSTVSPDLVPVGTVIEWPYSSAPSGYALCQGQAVSRASNPVLHNLASSDGYPHGAGDGSTTFNLPDYRRRMPVGKAASGTVSTLGETGGSWDHFHSNPSTSTVSSHSHSQGNTGTGGSHVHSMPSHSHAVNIGAFTSSGSSGSPAGTSTNIAYYNYKVAGDRASHTHTVDPPNTGTSSVDPGNTNTNGSHAHTNPSTSSAGGHSHTQGSTGSSNPPYIVVNFAIKLG